MGYFRRLLVGVIGALSLVGMGSATVGAQNDALVQFDSMTPVTGAAVGAVNDRGITGGGKPWAIQAGRGTVDEEGNVDVKVKDLVIPVAPFNGTNPVKTFRVTVSCLTPAGVVNVTTGPASTGPDGNANFETSVALPNRCNDPIVFVVNGTASPNGGFAWFAMSNSDD